MLNERQKRFLTALRGGAAADEAAVLAGYSQKRARRQAAELLRRPDIAAALREAAEREARAADFGAACVSDVTARCGHRALRAEEPGGAADGDAGDGGVGAGEIVRELARIAFADPADLPTDSAEGDMPRGSGTGLKVKYSPRRGADGGTVVDVTLEREVRVGDKLRALELLSKVLGLAERPPAEDRGGVVVLPEVNGSEESGVRS